MTRPRMTGGQLQDAVAELAQTFGGLVFHARRTRTKDGWRTPVAYDGEGYPDLTIAMPGGVVFAEIKGDGDRLRPDQDRWLKTLAGLPWPTDDHEFDETGRYENTFEGPIVAMWTPRHWREGHIEWTLRGLR